MPPAPLVRRSIRGLGYFSHHPEQAVLILVLLLLLAALAIYLHRRRR